MECKKTYTLLGAAALLSSMGCQGPVSRAERGKELYGYCVQCHGAGGSGNHAFRAPAIAGLSDWYVEAQLTKFRVGARGGHPRDVDGLRMRPMSRTLATTEEVRMVAAYVASMPPSKSPLTLTGDAERGAQLYKPCVQCHGKRAEGMQTMNAPPLGRLNDWYLVAQLQKFSDGVRGTDPLDATGAQMRSMTTGLTDEQAMRDVVAYISSLD